MIKQLVINGERLINLPADKQILIELGLSELEAEQALNDHKQTQALESIRAQRKPLLAEADYLVNAAMDKGQDVAPFREYRQALRDMTASFQTKGAIIWPKKPTLD